MNRGGVGFEGLFGLGGLGIVVDGGSMSCGGRVDAGANKRAKKLRSIYRNNCNLWFDAQLVDNYPDRLLILFASLACLLSLTN